MGVMLVNTIGVLPPIAEKQKALARASKAEMKRVHPLNDNGSGDLSHDKKCPCYHEESEPVSEEAMQKRSLWRKILGKGPKCRCAKIESERRIGKLEISDEYVGFISVRVSGKRIPYTREMHKRRRQLLNKMEAISE
ncbi:hypothetical protein Poli38472_013321 [Pythium oligandrum]|uniref:Uncharacterized protein n=1 Tax=Pythium oligandrum TaxID=41045 RepID=A0A8K1C796_PYTOL|nr:hypothetical protein Poli38472_013321 [Pythium oligandrum]|eukprot:TMW57847.1 hypothetical protein Poli38472_013321 [Pythium oligandrum]